MAVRIQFRRGTAAEWVTANPTLAAGEAGYETDTAKFKLGDGSSAWEALAYAGVNQSDIEAAVASVVDFAPETLDTLVELADAINNDPDVFNTLSTQITTSESNLIAYADGVESNSITYTNSVANSITTSVNSYTDNAIANLIDSSPSTLDTLNELAAALGDDPNFATTVATNLSGKINFIADSNLNFDTDNPTPILANTLYVTTDTRRIKVGDGIGDWANAVYVGEDFVLDHDFQTSVHGISNTMNLVYQVDLSTVESSLQNNIDVVSNDLGNAITDLTNVSTSFESTTNSISSTVDTLSSTVDTLVSTSNALDGRVGSLETESSDQGNSLTTLNASVGSLEDQANTLANTLEDVVTTLAPLSGAVLSSPTISGASLEGTTTLELDATVGGANSAELGHLSGVTSGIQAQIDTKSDIDSPSFTGAVVLPVTTTIGNVVGTEISALENVSSNIQSQLDAKLATASAASIYAPLSGPTFTGTVSLPATTSIGDVSAAELGHVNGVTSGIQGQLDVKAPLESPTFTGTVSGVTSSMVGLSNVDNTSDADKVVSTATQTALDAKLNLAGGTMTGKITLDGDPTQALHAVTKQYVDSVEAGLITRPSVIAATTENLTATYDNGTAGVGATLTLGLLAILDIDGVTSWSLLDGILVKNQTNKFENGRYVVEQIGNDVDTDWILRRCSLCDEAHEVPGSFTLVLQGTVNQQTGWVQHVADPTTFTVGVDDIDVYQFAGAGTVTAGSNISVTGSEISVVSNPTFANVITANSGVQFADNTIQTSAGVPSLTSFTEKTAGYTLDTVDHQDNVVEMNSASAIAFTIPTNATLAWPVGASMDIFQMGAGQVTIANAAGVTLNFTPGNKLRTQFSSCTIMKRGTDSWVLYGDLTA